MNIQPGEELRKILNTARKAANAEADRRYWDP